MSEMKGNKLFPAYRNLKVWNKAHQNLQDILALLEKVPNKPGIARIKDQMVGSASSIGANIAEGSSIYRGTKFISYLQISLDSACETDNWLQVIKDSAVINKYVDNQVLTGIIGSNYEVIKMLIKLIGKIEAKRREQAG